jgi:hypothetical protein
VEAVKCLAVANIEEFTTDFIYDRKRDTLLIHVKEVYVKEIKKKLFEMDYGLVFQHYATKTDTMTLVFTRW